METKDYAIIGLVALLVIGTAGVGGYMFAGGNSAPAPNDTTTTQTPREATAPPEEVNASKPGAAALYQELEGNYSNLRVFITERGEVVVSYTSDANSGPELKNEMAQIAYQYAGVMVEHPETGGLTVRANGVQMLVSSDTAYAYGNESIKQDAYKETFVYKTEQSQEDN